MVRSSANESGRRQADSRCLTLLRFRVWLYLPGRGMASPKILVVDDSRTVRVQVRQLLAEAGYQVVLAQGGDDGLRLVAVENPDLIILDIQMPGIDGYTLCQLVKQMGSPWDELPVVFITSLESHALNLLGHQMGAYLKKPVGRDALLEAVSCALDPQLGEKPVC